MLSYTVIGGEVVAQALAEMGRRAARSDIILPALKAAWAPVAADERTGIHSVSGALVMSLKQRSGSGDFAGRYSVYIAASATVKQVVRKWSGSSRVQHHAFAARASESGLGRYRVFYAPWVEKGHNIVRNGKIIGHAPAHKFAEPAFDRGAAEATEQAADNITDAILGE